MTALNPQVLDQKANEARRLRDHLLAEYPELQDDEQALSDTLEGICDLDTLVLAFAESAEDDLAMVDALKSRLGDMNTRAKRLSYRATRKRAAICKAMEISGVKKIEAPAMTISLVPRAPGVVITDESQIPDEFKKTKTVESIDKAALKSALNDKPVAGAQLDNGGVSVTIRTK